MFPYLNAPLGAQMAAQPGMVPKQAMPMQQGMFGAGNPRRGVDWGQLGAMLMAFSGNPLGNQLLQQRSRQQESQQEMQARAQQRQQDMADRWSMWQRQQEYERANPAPPSPTEFERTLRLSGIDPNSPEGRRLARQRAENLANPMTMVDVQQPDGSTVRQWIRPGQQSAPLPELDDEWEPISQGGPASPAPGNFPRGEW